MKEKKYYPPAMASLIFSIAGAAGFILFLAGPMRWFNLSLKAFYILISLAVITGIYSLVIKKNKLAWAGLSIALVFIILLIILYLLLRGMCVVC